MLKDDDTLTFLIVSQKVSKWFIPFCSKLPYLLQHKASIFSFTADWHWRIPCDPDLRRLRMAPAALVLSGGRARDPGSHSEYCMLILPDCCGVEAMSPWNLPVALSSFAAAPHLLYFLLAAWQIHKFCLRSFWKGNLSKDVFFSNCFVSFRKTNILGCCLTPKCRSSASVSGLKVLNK